MKLGEMPLYLAMKDLRKYVFHIVKHLPAYLKHSIGTRIIDSCCRCICDIATINRNKNHPAYQTECIKALLTEMDVLFDMIDFLVEEGEVSKARAAEVALKMELIEKQSSGLQKSFDEEIKKTCQNPKV